MIRSARCIASFTSTRVACNHHIGGKAILAVAQNLPGRTNAECTTRATLISSREARQNRHLSTQQLPKRGFAKYAVFGESSVISLSPILPTYKQAGAEGVAVDKKGRMILEWVPRSNDNKSWAWNDKIRLALSVEEIGLVINQLPHFPVEISRPLYAGQDDDTNSHFSGSGPVIGDMPEKVFKAIPGEGATITLSIDYVKDGIGGQYGEDGKTAPIEITVQVGEFEVMKSILKESIPFLTGFTALMKLSEEREIAQMGTSYNQGRFSGGGPGNMVPF
eukprot:CAMPEP_0198286752 /NCGR_PEP_ID=MMETSP1449-20131203/5731_1 /TAXON_ID=420275 /ORGANISM="Attheya septentrionalis, Strain CCMP2084" /LENGTH=276 /DNA_ID=CAMNT_0043984541 /DNA_START=142 /DNA_END=972 /DNA_ORIENTATION=+